MPQAAEDVAVGAKQNERLSSWKEIAAFLNVSVRTAQRWERTEGLPARRHHHRDEASVYAYRLELELWWNSRPQPLLNSGRPQSSPPSLSIAVLPFVNLGGKPNDDVLTDGLTEELITALAQVEGLKVVARTSSFHFKGKTEDVRVVGRQLGVRTVLEGSVRRHGKRMRITAQLLDVQDGCHLWARRFDCRLEDVFDLQDEITRQTVGALEGRLVGAGGKTPKGALSRDVEAYELYLRGRYHWNKRIPRELEIAADFLEAATARAPRMARAHAALADCYAMLASFGGIAAEKQAQRACSEAELALQLDSTLGEAHVALAFIRACHYYDWAGAENHFRQAIELNRDDARAHLFYAGIVLSPTGRLRGADFHQQIAAELDPMSPVVAGGFGADWVFQRQYDSAISACRRALELDPTYPWALRWLGEAYLLKGMPKEAADALERIQTPVFGCGLLAESYLRSGCRIKADQMMNDLENQALPGLALQRAILKLAVGNHEGAIECLGQACAARNVGIHWLNVDPIWDLLRPHRGFQELLRRMNLDSWKAAAAELLVPQVDLRLT